MACFIMEFIHYSFHIKSNRDFLFLFYNVFSDIWTLQSGGAAFFNEIMNIRR